MSNIYKIRRRILVDKYSLPLMGRTIGTVPPVIPPVVTAYHFNQLLPVIFEDF